MIFLNKKTKIILLICIIFLFIIFIFFYNLVQNNVSYTDYNELVISSNTDTSTNLDNALEEKIIIHILGEVLNPGIVSIDKNSRISDAITAAGGLSANADVSKVNLAFILKDGQKIYIPSIYDEDNVSYISNDAGNNVIVPDNNQESSSTININTATAEELDKLPGIGLSTANKIIDYRTKHGDFKALEDLMNVNGIGESKFENLKDFISF